MADFGVARFQCQGGVMTAETGTYRWMAPEVLLSFLVVHSMFFRYVSNIKFYLDLIGLT